MRDSFVLAAFYKKMSLVFAICMLLLIAVACGVTESTVESSSSASNEHRQDEFSGFASFIEQKMASDCIPGWRRPLFGGMSWFFRRALACAI